MNYVIVFLGFQFLNSSDFDFTLYLMQDALAGLSNLHVLKKCFKSTPSRGSLSDVQSRIRILLLRIMLNYEGSYTDRVRRLELITLVNSPKNNFIIETLDQVAKHCVRFFG
jgi:hypothetical protein